MAKKIDGLYLVNDRDNYASEPRLRPLYTVGEAARILSIPANTLHGWAIGRKKAQADAYYQPVLDSVDTRSGRLSFFDLVEAYILRAARDRNLRWKQIQRGVDYLRRQHPDDPRPLLSYSFKTDGKSLLVRGMLAPHEGEKENLVNASASGQIEMVELIDKYLTNIIRDKNGRLPTTIFPNLDNHEVSVTFNVLSGRPVIVGTRIPTSTVAQRARAGERPMAIAKDYGLSREKIVAAIKYEKAA